MGSHPKACLLKLLSDLEPQIKKLPWPATEFVRFKELPTELRLMIWQCAFPPGRHIDIDNHGVNKQPHYGEDDNDQNHNSSVIRRILFRDLPVTLYVNRESRHETLRYYHMIFPEDCFDQASRSTQLCVNPSRDSLHFSYPWIRWHLDDFFSWLVFLNRKIPGGLSSFQGIDIREITWFDIEIQSSESHKHFWALFWILNFFTGIPKLALTLRYLEGRNTATKFWFEAERFLEYIPVGPQR